MRFSDIRVARSGKSLWASADMSAKILEQRSALSLQKTSTLNLPTPKKREYMFTLCNRVKYINIRFYSSCSHSI